MEKIAIIICYIIVLPFIILTCYSIGFMVLMNKQTYYSPHLNNVKKNEYVGLWNLIYT